MPECPACFGHGQFDDRDIDAEFEEFFSDAELRAMGHVRLGVTQCEECEGTGIVSEDRRKDLIASYRAAVSQVIAHYEEHKEEIENRPRDRLDDWLDSVAV